LPAGFSEADPGRDRLTAPRKRAFGGFEDKSGADRETSAGDANAARLNRAVRLTSDRFVPSFTMRVKFPILLALWQLPRALG